jgi:hypothetical protein
MIRLREEERIKRKKLQNNEKLTKYKLSNGIAFTNGVITSYSSKSTSKLCYTYQFAERRRKQQALNLEI